MSSLESTSRRTTPLGRMRHAGGEQLDRHCHHAAFAAIVLRGGYVEAGDTGRHRVAPGEVIIHHRFESHLNRIGSHGAEVLVLPLDDGWAGPVLGRLNDPESLVRLAERSAEDGCAFLRNEIKARSLVYEDWPDLLAADLIADPGLSIADWACAHRLHPGSVSRGFRQQFGVTPAGFRLATRTARATRAIVGSEASFADAAVAEGFADQAHMANAVRRLTGLTPGRLRRHAQAG